MVATVAKSALNHTNALSTQIYTAHSLYTIGTGSVEGRGFANHVRGLRRERRLLLYHT